MKAFLGSLARGVVLTLSILLVVVLAADVVETARAPSAVSQPVRQSTVVLSVSANPSHKLTGIGASGAWWSSPVYALGAKTRSRVGQLLYSKSGLRLSQFRFNIGGGGVGVDTPWKAPPSFYQPNGTLNLAADPQGVFFLKQAKRYGVKDLVGFVNSAPPEFTSNKQSCGGYLLHSKIDAYAQELAATVAGIAATYGVRLSYLSPMNEPAGSQPACRQEGMRVPVAERGPLIVALAHDLSVVAPWCRVIADESSFVNHQFLGAAPVWTAYPGVRGSLAALAFHGYDFPSKALLSKVAALSKKVGVPVWATEICCYDGAGFGYQYDPTMTSAMWLATTIYNDLMVAGASAFDWWLALSPDLGCDPAADPSCFRSVNVLGRNDGLIYFDLNGLADGDRQLYLTKRYYVLGNFSRYLRPGASLVPVATSDARVEALAAVEGNQEVVVAINLTPQGSPNLPLQIDFPGGKGALIPEKAVSTSSSKSLSKIDLPTVSGRIALALSEPFSVTSYVFRIGHRLDR